MDLRTGTMYDSKEAALRAGVPEGDPMLLTEEQQKMYGQIPQTLKFKKSPFATIKNPKQTQNV